MPSVVRRLAHPMDAFYVDADAWVNKQQPDRLNRKMAIGYPSAPSFSPSTRAAAGRDVQDTLQRRSTPGAHLARRGRGQAATLAQHLGGGKLSRARVEARQRHAALERHLLSPAGPAGRDLQHASAMRARSRAHDSRAPAEPPVWLVGRCALLAARLRAARPARRRGSRRRRRRVVEDCLRGVVGARSTCGELLGGSAGSCARASSRRASSSSRSSRSRPTCREPNSTPPKLAATLAHAESVAIRRDDDLLRRDHVGASQHAVARSNVDATTDVTANLRRGTRGASARDSSSACSIPSTTEEREVLLEMTLPRPRLHAPDHDWAPTTAAWAGRPSVVAGGGARRPTASGSDARAAGSGGECAAAADASFW